MLALYDHTYHRPRSCFQLQSDGVGYSPPSTASNHNCQSHRPQGGYQEPPLVLTLEGPKKFPLFPESSGANAKQGSCLVMIDRFTLPQQTLQSRSRSNGSIVAECRDDKTSRLAK
jgi:hypothetical protein